MNCTGGNSPDVLLRLPMPAGPFNEPYGTDCYFNLVAFQVLGGGLVALGNLVLACIVSVDLCIRARNMSISGASSNRPSPQWRRRVGLLELGSAFLLLACLSSAAFVVCGVYAPLACRALWPVCWLGALTYVSCYLGKLAVSAVSLLHKLQNTSTITVQSYVGNGSRAWGAALLGGWAVSMIMTVVGAAVSAAVFDPNDEAAALVAQQVHFAGLAWWSFNIFCAQHVVSGQFIRIVEQVTASAEAIRAGPPSPQHGNNSNNNNNNSTSEEIAALLVRFKLCRQCGPVALPLSVGVNVAHAVLLPPLYYLVLLQLANAMFVGYVGWFGLTPTNRRQRVFRVLTCGLLRGTDPTGGGMSPKMSSTARSSRLQAGLLTSANI